MNRSYLLIISLVLLLGASNSAAELVSTVGVSSGYSGNLFNDFNRANDVYTSVYAGADLYPTRSSMITLFGNYTAYSKYSDLSSVVGGAEIAVIPTPERSPFSMNLSASLLGQSYGEYYQGYDYHGADFAIAAAYTLRPGIIFRGGMNAGLTRYPNSFVADHRLYFTYLGVNLSLPGSNSLNIEGGYGIKDYHNMKAEVSRRNNSGYESKPDPGQLPVYNLTFRISRPLGPAIGLSLGYEIRRFGNYQSTFINDFTDYSLSPWASDWEGSQLNANFKTYVIPHMITTLGGSYRDMVYVMTLTPTTNDDFEEYNRDDRRYDLYFSISRPIKAGSGLLLKPTIRIEYSDNESSDGYYNYTDMAVSAGLSFQF